jgi:hypothetical protein
MGMTTRVDHILFHRSYYIRTIVVQWFCRRLRVIYPNSRILSGVRKLHVKGALFCEGA